MSLSVKQMAKLAQRVRDNDPTLDEAERRFGEQIIRDQDEAGGAMYMCVLADCACGGREHDGEWV